MPFYKITLQGEKRPSPNYPKELKSLGDHMRKRRLDLGLTQDEVAVQLGAHRNTLSEWETTGRPPDDKHLGRIYAFLGYRPDPIPAAFPAKVKYWRQSLGMSQIQLSRAIGLNHSVVREWETGVAPKKRSLERLKVFLEERLGVTV